MVYFSYSFSITCFSGQEAKGKLKPRKLICILLLAALAFGAFAFYYYRMPITDTRQTLAVRIDVEYHQSEAREILDLVNHFRAVGDDDERIPWYWSDSETNSKKKYVRNLKPMIYDYDLEKLAMQRAAELAVRFEHTRPNGEPYYEMEGYWGTYRSVSENLAAGYETKENVFIGWAEYSEPYAGQGHRRNMLSKDYTAIGIAHIYCNGTHFWVQEFGDKARNTTPTQPVDSTVTVTVDIDDGVFETRCPISSILSLPKDRQDLPVPVLTVKTEASFMERPCPIQESLEWLVEDPAVAEISEDTLIAKGEGTTNLIGANRYGHFISIPITVKRGDISNSPFTQSLTVCTYSGKPITPEVKVRFDSAELIQDVDYTVSYRNNIDVGTSVIVVTGIDRYIGSFASVFTILPVETSIVGLSADSQSIAVQWKKQTTQVSGYHIQYSKSPSFAYVSGELIVPDCRMGSETIRNLEEDTAYFIRIRTYQTVNGEKFFSGWSKAKRISTTEPEIQYGF